MMTVPHFGPERDKPQHGLGLGDYKSCRGLLRSERASHAQPGCPRLEQACLLSVQPGWDLSRAVATTLRPASGSGDVAFDLMACLQRHRLDRNPFSDVQSGCAGPCSCDGCTKACPACSQARPCPCTSCPGPHCTWHLQVRTSAAGIVQLQYGEDGRDPMVMEGDGGDPVDFARCHGSIAVIRHRPQLSVPLLSPPHLADHRQASAACQNFPAMLP